MKQSSSKKDLIKQVSSKTATSQALTETIINAFLDSIKNELGKGSEVNLRDFGVFKTTQRPAGTIQTPLMKTPKHVEAKTVVKFKPYNDLKVQINS